MRILCSVKEVRQRKTDAVWPHLHVESEVAKLIETESRMNGGCQGFECGGHAQMSVKGYKLPATR